MRIENKNGLEKLAGDIREISSQFNSKIVQLSEKVENHIKEAEIFKQQMEGRLTKLETPKICTANVGENQWGPQLTDIEQKLKIVSNMQISLSRIEKKNNVIVKGLNLESNNLKTELENFLSEKFTCVVNVAEAKIISREKR